MPDEIVLYTDEEELKANGPLGIQWCGCCDHTQRAKPIRECNLSFSEFE